MLPADQLVRDRHADNVADAAPAAQVEGAEMVDVADQPDDCPRHSAADECLAARRPDQIHYRVDISLGHLGSHHDYHLVLLALTNDKKAPGHPAEGLEFTPCSALAHHRAGFLPVAGRETIKKLIGVMHAG